MVAPNISKDGQPIQFKVTVDKGTEIQVSLYTLVGEQVYSVQIEAAEGLNILTWPLENDLGQQVASGLYIYVIREGTGSSLKTKAGKVVVIH
jgi:hypothetical protein